MEYKILEKQELGLMKEILEDDEMDFDLNNLNKFIEDSNNYGFIAKENNKIVGFIYGYSLLKPNLRLSVLTGLLFNAFLYSCVVMPTKYGRLALPSILSTFMPADCRLDSLSAILKKIASVSMML